MNIKEELESECEEFNNTNGSMDRDGYSCSKCKNRGLFEYVIKTDFGYYQVVKECECMRVHRLIQGMKESGLGDMLKIYKFANYSHDTKWQDYIFAKANDFVKMPTNCFYIGGQVGSGKTHICTAIVGELMKQERSNIKYVVWEELATLLKQEAYDDKESYNERLDDLRNCNVLYIDDLFKTSPTPTDIKNCFNIVNYRYNLSRTYKDERYVTVISSEKTITDLIQIDEAIASRIYELANGYCLSIGKDNKKNYRFRDMVEL